MRGFLILVFFFVQGFSLSKHTNTNTNTFVFTKALYNGTVSYDGMIYACNKEYFNSAPCNNHNLMEGNFWRSKFYATSWVLSLQNYDWQGNCQAYTTDDGGNMGTCLMSQVPYITQCSCNEYLPICCAIAPKKGGDATVLTKTRRLDHYWL